MNGEVMVVQDRLVVTEKEIQQLKYQYDMFRKLQQVVLEENVDYGFPAGKKSQDQKPSLYKSGAEKLTRLFNLTPEFELIKQIEEQGFIMYAFRCQLKTSTGQLVGEGYGACNSREKQGWNANPWAFQNNILKMAKKRAHVDAVLTGLGASNVFTQDIEDTVEDQHQRNENKHTEPTGDQERKLTEKQMRMIRGLINSLAEETESSPEEVEAEIKNSFKIEHFSNLTVSQASNVIAALQDQLKAITGVGQ
ncbi:MAG TPA: DUF1018 domain-containing protein [Pseudothermotoga sp.]|nr:DUF1018 domain-containing protein [Pseudothermotoga sp.]